MTVGIDEVGRGAWAGPLVAAAVLLDHNFTISKDRPWKCTDSKLLSAKQRLVAGTEIRRAALAIGIGWVTPAELDRRGMSAALTLVMMRAVGSIRLPYRSIIIDGRVNYLSNLPAKTIVGADKDVPVVSAASIIAKVARDMFMGNIALLFPDYGFESHVGYGTKSHQAAIGRHGITRLHRRSFKPVAAILNTQLG